MAPPRSYPRLLRSRKHFRHLSLDAPLDPNRLYERPVRRGQSSKVPLPLGPGSTAGATYQNPNIRSLRTRIATIHNPVGHHRHWAPVRGPGATYQNPKIRSLRTRCSAIRNPVRHRHHTSSIQRPGRHVTTLPHRRPRPLSRSRFQRDEQALEAPIVISRPGWAQYRLYSPKAAHGYRQPPPLPRR